MNVWLKRILIGLGILLVIIQFFTGTKPTVTTDNPGDIHTELLIDAEVSSMLKSACYDCHSNETRYPWYANVAPISWLVIKDTNEGRDELNFSEWASYTEKRKHHKLEELIEEVEEGEMPMPIYKVTHADARLSEEQIAQLTSWARERMAEINPRE